DRARTGSGCVSRHGKDSLQSMDPWFRGTALKQGPDGSLFMADWNDAGECHDYDKVERGTGRIFKVAYGKPSSDRADLTKLDESDLIAELCCVDANVAGRA